MNYRVVRHFRLEIVKDETAEYAILDNWSYEVGDYQDFASERDAQDYAWTFREQMPSAGIFVAHVNIPGRWILLYDAAHIQKCTP